MPTPPWWRASVVLKALMTIQPPIWINTKLLIFRHFWKSIVLVITTRSLLLQMAQLPHLCCIPEHLPPTTQNADTQESYGSCPTRYISKFLKPETGRQPCRKTRQQKCHQEVTSCLVMHLKASKWATDHLVKTVAQTVSIMRHKICPPSYHFWTVNSTLIFSMAIKCLWQSRSI